MPAHLPVVLLVEDEPAIAELVRYALQTAGWQVQLAENVAQAGTLLSGPLPQAILLDWMLPDGSGLNLLTRIRSEARWRKLPVIMLTAKGMEEDKIKGLDSGADDYIIKPFSPRELVSRLRAVVRSRQPEHDEQSLSLGQIVLDPVTHRVLVDGKPIDIGQSEFRLLKCLMAHPGRVFSRSQLLDRVWGDHVAIEERTVDVHVLRLRKALGPAGQLVRTVRGAGYSVQSESQP